jgi:nucleotidyltransferase AbiEii toxin of type IV toxin-antitoxin system
VDCLSIPDCYAEKLLANSDRWADRQVLSRDLIDLSALRINVGPVPRAAWQKVGRAYKEAAKNDLLKAISAFAEDPSYQRRCFQGLRLDDPAKFLKGMDQLRREVKD